MTDVDVGRVVGLRAGGQVPTGCVRPAAACTTPVDHPVLNDGTQREVSPQAQPRWITTPRVHAQPQWITVHNGGEQPLWIITPCTTMHGTQQDTMNNNGTQQHPMHKALIGNPQMQSACDHYMPSNENKRGDCWATKYDTLCELW